MARRAPGHPQSTCPNKPPLPGLGGLFVSAGVDEGLSVLAMAVQNGSQLDKLRDSARYFRSIRNVFHQVVPTLLFSVRFVCSVQFLRSIYSLTRSHFRCAARQLTLPQEATAQNAANRGTSHIRSPEVFHIAPD